MKKSLLIQGVPGELKQRFKAACARRGMSMKKVLIRQMEIFSVKADNTNGKGR